jgi:O-antigen/teichoic acid export membrane protein
VSTGLVVYGVIGTLTVAVGGALSWFVPHLLGLEGDLVGAARLAAFLVVVGLVVRFPLGLFWNLLLAQQRYDITNAGSLASIALYALLVVTLVKSPDDLVVLAVAALAATVLRLALPLAWLRRELPFLRPRLAFVTRERVRELLAFSWHNFLIHLAAKVVFAADVVVVGIVLGAKAAAFYAIPAKLFTLAFQVGTGATNVLYPAFAELEGAEEPARQRAYLRAGLRAGMALMLLFAVPLIFIPDLLIHAWIGSGFGPSTSVMVLLGFALVVHQPIQVLTQYLVARRLQAPLARVLVAVVAANLVLSSALALLVGLWGVAAATLATELVALVLIPRLARESGLGAAALARLVLRPVAPALAVGLVVFLPVRALGLDNLLLLAPVGALWVVGFALAVWRLGLSRAERRVVGKGLGLRRGSPAIASSAPDALS